ncbi:MAG TPA: type VI secretion system tube protein Hcp [Chthoniobacteraceae bacterium]|jgi:type VI secretion system secreted protein Hcp|nr:type VI secretion system tube protein Hcp [Chthoniobacteraceae bacterium]
MKTPRALLFALLLLLPFAASAQSPPPVKLFLKLAGIDGESTTAGHETDVPLLTCSFGANQLGLSAAGGTANAAKSVLSTITVQKLVDKTSPILFIDCALGKPIHDATIFFRNASTPAGPVDNFRVTLTNVLISSYHVDATDGDSAIMESVSLSYTSMKVSYTPIDPNGALKAPISYTFNVQTNKQVADPLGPQ